MNTVNLALEQIQGIITFMTAIVTFMTAIVMLIVVCGPMNHRKFIEKAFLVSVAISLIGASMRRMAKQWGYYDADGSMLFLAELILILARMHAIIFGVWVTALWTAQCRARRLRLDLPHGNKILRTH